MKIDTEVSALVVALQEKMKEMRPQERVDLLDAIAGCYCPRCGDDISGRRCHCDRDE